MKLTLRLHSTHATFLKSSYSYCLSNIKQGRMISALRASNGTHFKYNILDVPVILSVIILEFEENNRL